MWNQRSRGRYWGIDALRPLVEPLVFLMLAVPLALMLDDIGVFDALARRFPTPSLSLLTWLLACGTVAILNLDAAVVLLTPLYVRLARHRGRDPLAFAFQPMLAACVASSGLPVSNLTNLIAASSRHLSAADFLRVLGLPTLVSSAVAYLGWRFAFRHALAAGAPEAPIVDEPAPEDRHALRVGAIVIAALVVGFIPLRSVGVPAWAVVAVVIVGLLPVTGPRRLARPPVATAALVLALAAVVQVAGRHLHIARLLGSGQGALGMARATAVGAVAANLVNNLPAFLVGLDHLPAGHERVLWAMLLGVNAGPVLVVSGTLSTLLWRRLAVREGLQIRARDVARVGAIAGIPALLAALSTLVISHH